MLKDRRGMTLMEIIVVIAIMGVLSGIVGSSIASLNGTRALECVTKLEATLSKTRIDSLAREGSTYLVLSKTDSGIKLSTYVNVTGTPERLKEETIGVPQLEVTYTDSAGASVTLSDTNSLYLTFSRSTGAFKTIAEAAALHGATVAGAYCEEIEVKSGVRTSTLMLVPETGRFTSG